GLNWAALALYLIQLLIDKADDCTITNIGVNNVGNASASSLGSRPSNFGATGIGDDLPNGNSATRTDNRYVQSGHAEILKALSQKVPMIFGRAEKKGQTLLHMVVKLQNVKVVNWIIKKRTKSKPKPYKIKSKREA
nr:ankyrin repeat-containing protein At5g02620-like [Tanacetum cinerariifolium]